MPDEAGAGFTTIVTRLVDARAVSETANCRTYVPEVEKLAVVLNAFMLPRVTVPGPLDIDHVVVSVPDGRPSSVAVPLRFAEDGNVIVWLEPALTTGAWFVGVGDGDGDGAGAGAGAGADTVKLTFVPSCHTRAVS